MKAYRLELPTVKMADEVYDPTTKSYKSIERGDFSYQDIIKNILYAGGGNGSSTEEVIKSLSIFSRIRQSYPAPVLLNKEEYDFLISRLNAYRWAIAHPVVGEFVQHLRSLPQVEVTEKVDPPNN